LGDWAPAPLIAPPLLEDVPLPDSDSQQMDIDLPEGTTSLSYPKIHKSEPTDTLRKQQDQMTKLLDEMQQLDKGSPNATIKQAYLKAHQAITDGLQAVKQQICGESDGMGEVISGGSNNGSINKSSPPEHLQRRWVRLLLEDGEMSLADADHYLRSKYGKGVGDDECEVWKRGVKWREQGGGGCGVHKPDCVRSGCGLQGPGGTEGSGVAAGCRSGDGTSLIRDPNFNMGQRWRGVIENAVIEGQMLPNSLTAFPVFTQGNQQIWAPFDWKTVSQLQKTVMNYGLDNKQVMTLVTIFFKNQILVPADARALLELVLPPTAVML